VTIAERWAKVRPWAMVAAALAIGLFVVPRWCRTPLLPKGTQIPAFVLPRADDPSRTVSSQDLRGRRAVLYFWAVWCPACERMRPGLAALARERSDVAFLAIHSDGDVDPRAVAARAESLPGPTYLVGGESVIGSFRATTFPTTYVVGSDGRICDGFSGRADPSDVAEAIDACR
jgi:thiol-disulfide isomerase/thioredoxin